MVWSEFLRNGEDVRGQKLRLLPEFRSRRKTMRFFPGKSGPGADREHAVATDTKPPNNVSANNA